MWVNEDRIFIFAWTSPSQKIKLCHHSCRSKPVCILYRRQKKIFWRMLITKQVWFQFFCPYNGSKWNCLVTNILQSIFFCVPQKKGIHTVQVCNDMTKQTYGMWTIPLTTRPLTFNPEPFTDHSGVIQETLEKWNGEREKETIQLRRVRENQRWTEGGEEADYSSIH